MQQQQLLMATQTEQQQEEYGADGGQLFGVSGNPDKAAELAGAFEGVLGGSSPGEAGGAG